MSKQHDQSYFSPYILLNSIMQLRFGMDRRKTAMESFDDDVKFNDELREMQYHFQDEMEDAKEAEMRARFATLRKFQSIEKAESYKQTEFSQELRTFFEDKNFPLLKKSIPIIISLARDFLQTGHMGNLPLNVVLLHTNQSKINYESICDSLDKYVPYIQNVIFRRWCKKDVARNASIYNIHYLMAGIPTFLISPVILNNMVHYTVSLWDANSDTFPLIRPILSLPFDESLLNSDSGKSEIQNQIAFVSTILTVCARDSYEMYTLGKPLNVVGLLQNNPSLVSMLNSDKYSTVRDFLFSEYDGISKNLYGLESNNLISKNEVLILAKNVDNNISKLHQLLPAIE